MWVYSEFTRTNLKTKVVLSPAILGEPRKIRIFGEVEKSAESEKRLKSETHETKKPDKKTRIFKKTEMFEKIGGRRNFWPNVSNPEKH